MLKMTCLVCCLDLTANQTSVPRRDVPVVVLLDLFHTDGNGLYWDIWRKLPDNVSKYCVLLVAFLLLWHEKLMSLKNTVNS